MAELTDLQRAILEYDSEAATKLAKKALEDGKEPVSIIDEELRPAMDMVGKKFEAHEFFLPHLVMCADAMKAAVDVLLSEASLEEIVLGTIVIGTVEGDVHDIGKSLVSAFLRSSGFEVHDIGVDNKTQAFIEKAKEVNADIICASALMTATMPYQEDLVSILRDSGLRERFKVMIGGAPTNAAFAEKIGADAWGENATEAVETARKLVSG
ncbi:MAG: corrinoid protein [Candidatus Bathyarchaeota archaeon]|nr:MAG: corrinoid protein [Candidatus Bathyarchaeota archaeon]